MNWRLIFSATAALTAACAAAADRYRSSLVGSASSVPPTPPPEEGDQVTISGFSHICDVDPSDAETKARCILGTNFVREKLAHKFLEGLSFGCGEPQYRGDVKVWDKKSRSEKTRQRFEMVCGPNGRSITALRPIDAVMKIMETVGLDPWHGLDQVEGDPTAITPEDVLPRTAVDHLCVYLRREWREGQETGLIDHLACQALGDKALQE